MSDTTDTPESKASVLFDLRMPKISQRRVATQQDKASHNLAGTQQLLSYWNEMRRGFDLPRRADIDPRGIETILANTFILERIAPQLARFRVAGVHLTNIMGMDVRGMPLSTVIQPAVRAELATAVQQVFDTPAILHADLTSKSSGLSGPDVAARLLILPLRSDMGDVSRAIGCIISDGAIRTTPCRFTFETLRLDKVVAAQRAAFAKTEADPRIVPAGPGRPSYLRVVVTD